MKKMVFYLEVFYGRPNKIARSGFARAYFRRKKQDKTNSFGPNIIHKEWGNWFAGWEFGFFSSTANVPLHSQEKSIPESQYWEKQNRGDITCIPKIQNLSTIYLAFRCELWYGGIGK